MSDLILGILPILIMWALPLAPMAYAAIAAIAEGVAKRRQVESDPRSAAAHVVRFHPQQENP